MNDLRPPPEPPRRPKRDYVRPLDLKHGRVDMTHGSGGRAMAQLDRRAVPAAFDNDWLAPGQRPGRFDVPPELAAGGWSWPPTATWWSPLFFPGGDIGCLSVHGTVNDVAMAGAKPLYLAASFILEEGFPLADLKRIVESMARAAREAGVPIVTGDTKVVEQGKGDGVFITTTGIGVVPAGVRISGDRARPGDAILVSRHPGRPRRGHHGAAREPRLRHRIRLRHRGAARPGGGDGAAVPDIHVPARPHARRPRHHAQRNRPPVRRGHAARRGRAAGAAQEVAAACEFLGLDPLYVANEGKLVCICAPEHAERLLAVMRATSAGRASAHRQVHGRRRTTSCR
jgi:hydrogenase expression/formation protein HypE